MQFAAAADLERIGAIGLADAQRDVRFEFPHQPLADLPRREVLAVAPRERRRVDAEEHRDRRLVDGDGADGLRRVRIGERVADVEALDAGDADDVARRRLVDLDPLQAGECEQLRQPVPEFGRAAVVLDLRDRRVDLRAAAENAADADAADVLVVVDRADQHLERAFFARRLRRRAQDRVEERLEVGAGNRRIERRGAGLRVGIDDLEVGLLVGRAELDEEVEHFVDDFRRARVLAVDLVDDDDRVQVEFERLTEHETRLRHHALGGVHEQQHALHHLQHAFHLAAEVGVARRVDDVELDVAVADRRVLREDGDAALALERVGVHHARRDGLAFAEDAALPQHGVDEGGLAVVDVSDDRHVPQVGAGHRVISPLVMVLRSFIVLVAWARRVPPPHWSGVVPPVGTLFGLLQLPGRPVRRRRAA